MKPMISKDETFLRRYIAQLKADRELWAGLKPYPGHPIEVCVPHMLPALQGQQSIWLDVTEEQIASVIEQISDLISYSEYDLTRFSKPEGSA